MIDLIPTYWSDLGPYALSMLLMGFYLCLAPLLPRRRTWARVLVVAICLAVAVRYLRWRLFHTILPAELISGEGVWYLSIYVVELFAFLNYSIFYLILSRYVDRSSEADRCEAELRKRPVEQLASVDVFIPTYNEGPDVLHRTILAALGIDYPKFQVWVLDDGGRDWLAEFCAEKGANYVRRTDRRHAKAGNLNHGLTVTSGELFAIFDADFAASRNFLYRTAGFFDDARIGILQTPQHFFNPDPIQLNLGCRACCRMTSGSSSRSWPNAVMPGIVRSAAARAAFKGERPSRRSGECQPVPSPRTSSPRWSCSGRATSRAT